MNTNGHEEQAAIWVYPIYGSNSCSFVSIRGSNLNRRDKAEIFNHGWTQINTDEEPNLRDSSR
jgi:hypothetical protein